MSETEVLFQYDFLLYKERERERERERARRDNSIMSSSTHLEGCAGPQSRQETGLWTEDLPDQVQRHRQHEAAAGEHAQPGLLAVAVHTHELWLHVPARHQQLGVHQVPHRHRRTVLLGGALEGQVRQAGRLRRAYVHSGEAMVLKLCRTTRSYPSELLCALAV